MMSDTAPHTFPAIAFHGLTKEGRYVMSNEEYHSDKAHFSSSQFKEALKSPLHFKFYVIDKKGSKKASAAMDKGTLVHTVILEPHLIDAEYIIHSGDTNIDGSVSSASKKILENKNPGKRIVSKAWYDFAVKARRSFEKYPQANELLFDKANESEISYFTTCVHTGLRIRVRPDILNLEKGYIIDLKTSRAKDVMEFKKDAKYNFHYDLSAFQYVQAIYQATGVLCTFYFAVVGTEDMCPVWMLKASEEFMNGGKAKYLKSAYNIQTALTTDNLMSQSEIEDI